MYAASGETGNGRCLRVLLFLEALILKLKWGFDVTVSVLILLFVWFFCLDAEKIHGNDGDQKSAKIFELFRA